MNKIRGQCGLSQFRKHLPLSLAPALLPLQMSENYHRSPAFLGLQPLRIPAGWKIDWNALYETSRVEDGDFGGSSVFLAVNEGRRCCIDVEFRPEFDPAGHFTLTVQYQPWPRTEKGRRRPDVPLRFDDAAEVVHSFTTRSYAEMVDRLSEWIARCTMMVREQN